MADFTFDPLDADFLENPYPTFSELRQRHPLYWHEGMQSWVVSRYDDCLRILRDTDVFGADPRRFGQDLPKSRISVQTLDGAEHARIRDVIVTALQGTDQSIIEGRVDKLLGQLIKGLDSTDSFDFVQSVAVPLTTKVSLSLFELPTESVGRVSDASIAIVRSMMHGLIPEGATTGLAEREIVTNTLDAWYEEADSGLLRTIRNMPQSEFVDRDALLNSLRVVLLAGINSTQRLLALSLRALLSREDGLRSFSSSPSRFQAINELVRFEGSAQSAARFCVKPIILHGRRIEEGQSIIALLGSANRDDRRFEDPDTLILDRRPNPHLGFGRGAHACVGIALAQSIGGVALEALGRDYPLARLTGPAVIERNPALRGLISLPVGLT
ncbi:MULTISPECIES: cytochrome P450 [unclassified Nocardia]|uniref:cytochrome P450 n=1 Tax=unclassified Nocardia TaxID=2637762 RepID=UPI001CE3D20C|nr:MULTISPECIES: cytochrome P450 [unclassified Nocardia]